jgi:prepilin-type processing-associated H-X9-DG protein
VGILLPALNKARESANTIKCAANLRSIGQGLAIYVAENRQTFPASYIYVGHAIVNGHQTPSDPINGYIHWSSYLYKKGNASNQDAVYRALSGWDAFQCPSLDKGGLPPTDTYDGNLDPGQNSQYPGIIDQQAPRIAYTANEAIMPRNKFVKGDTIDGALIQTPEHFVKAGQIKKSSEIILVTELTANWRLVSSNNDPSIGSSGACKSHRPVVGFIGTDGTQDIPSISGATFGRGNITTIRQCTANDLLPDPEAGSNSVKSRLDWVGRNHGRKQLQGGFDIRKTNFLYVDGHVETKGIKDTLTPFQWGESCYCIN